MSFTIITTGKSYRLEELAAIVTASNDLSLYCEATISGERVGFQIDRATLLAGLSGLLTDVDGTPQGATSEIDFVAGTNVTLGAAMVGGKLTLTINSTAGGGGVVETIVGTTDQIDVNSTDPANLVLSLAAAVIASLGLADTATQPAALAAAIADFITEADVIDTARQFTKGQGTEPVALSITGGNVTPDLATGNAFTLDVSADYELQLPTNDRTTSWHIRCTVTGGGGYTTTTVAGYVADGGGTVTLPTVTGDKYTLFCQSYGDGTHSIAIHTDQA